MIAHTCRRCGSTQLRKNGRTTTGHQKIHCKACNVYGTLDTQTVARAERKHLAGQLQLERLSQRAVARTLKMSRRTVARVWKKKRA
jgi:transposase-like protein